MDQHSQRGRSPSAGHHQPHIAQAHSSSPGAYQPNDPSAGLGLSMDQSPHLGAFNNPNNNFLTPQQQQAVYAQQGGHDPSLFDSNTSFSHHMSASGPESDLPFPSQQSEYLSPNLNDGDFSLFPPSGGPGDSFNTPLFEQSTLNPSDINSMTSPQSHNSPTPPTMLQLDSHQPGSAQHSPSFNQHQFPSPTGAVHHSRHASLGPEAALLPNQMGDWSQPQFQRHRRSPSAHSDVSSVSPSPNLITSDSFDGDASGHSPLQQASDAGLYQDVLNIGNFSISDPGIGSPNHRSPSHSPAISPRIGPQQMPDLNHQQFGLVPPSGGDFGAAAGAGYPNVQVTNDPFPSLQAGLSGSDVPQMAPPSINIDYAPNNNLLGKPQLDQDSLTPPERGRPRSRQRAVTDPFHPGGGLLGRPNNSQSPTPSLGSDLSPRSDASRSLSPLDRASSAARRRQSTSSVPNNVIALRLADPEYQSSQDTGSTKRVQKHPATFQCTLCPKRFTRAYNLRSHLRTHTDERPFVCTVCGKAFARQHDRKRHESLHSGEKKFVCKGDLKGGGQWGCGRRFARADALGRHFRSEAGRICIKPLLDEEMLERQRQWNEQRMQQAHAQGMVMQAPGMMMAPGMDPNTGGYPMDASGHYALPQALLAQYPALAQMNWGAENMGGVDEDMSGRSSFDASDYDDGDDGGYVSGPGTGFGPGGLQENFGDMGYASDYGGR